LPGLPLELVPFLRAGHHIMISLIPRSKVHQAHFHTFNAQFLATLIELGLLGDLSKRPAQRKDSKLALQFQLDQFLVAKVALVIFADKKHYYWLLLLLVWILASRLLVVLDALGQASNQFIHLPATVRQPL